MFKLLEYMYLQIVDVYILLTISFSQRTAYKQSLTMPRVRMYLEKSSMC